MQSKYNQSEQCWQKAKAIFPGGVNSPVRAFQAVGGDPIFMQKAHGATLTDVDGNTYLDYIGGWGPMILGHAHPAVVASLQAAAESGVCLGAPNTLATKLAERIQHSMPQLDQIRFVNSGTEAAMTAIRLSRGITGRDKIIKFAGCYHGHADNLLVSAGSGALSLGVPSSAGVTAGCAANTLVADYNDLDSVSALFEKNPGEIAAVIIEPIAGNMNLIQPTPGFLKGLRELCTHEKTLLIFDEVMTGFRVAHGGATEIVKIQPDLTLLGKIIGGGLPVGAIGGRHDLLSQLAPTGPVYQAGTLSANPLAMAAGLTTLNTLTDACYQTLAARSKQWCEGLIMLASSANVPLSAQHCGGMFGVYLGLNQPPDSLTAASAQDLGLFNAFFHGMLEAGHYFAPSMYEAGFMSLAHNETDIDQTLDAASQVLIKIREKIAC